MEIADGRRPLAMCNEMDFVSRAPAIRYTLWEPIDLSNVVLDLAQVARLVEILVRCMFTIKVCLAVDCSSKIGPIVSQIAVGLKIDDSNDLLVELTGSIVQAVKRPDISLVDFVVLDHIRIGHVGPIVTPERSLVWCPACKAVDQHDWVVV